MAVTCTSAAFLSLCLVLASWVISASAEPYHILAFGDSLTEGLTGQYSRYHPYATRLQELLRKENPSVQVEESGVSGERVLVTMRERLATELQEASSKGIKFHWVIILAGVNDIGWGAGAEEIFHGLRRMYHHCVKAGSRVVAMTNTENAGSGSSPRDADRQRLNNMIREWVARHGSQPNGPLLVDLERKMPYVSGTEEQRAQLFDDGLHFTDRGYDFVAEQIAEVLGPLLPRQALWLFYGVNHLLKFGSPQASPLSERLVSTLSMASCATAAFLVDALDETGAGCARTCITRLACLAALAEGPLRKAHLGLFAVDRPPPRQQAGSADGAAGAARKGALAQQQLQLRVLSKLGNGLREWCSAVGKLTPRDGVAQVQETAKIALCLKSLLAIMATDAVAARSSYRAVHVIAHGFQPTPQLHRILEDAAGSNIEVTFTVMPRCRHSPQDASGDAVDAQAQHLQTGGAGQPFKLIASNSVQWKDGGSTFDLDPDMAAFMAEVSQHSNARVFMCAEGPVSCERQVLLWLQPLLPPPPVPSLTLSWPQPQQALTGAHGLEQGAAVAGAHVLLPLAAEGQAGKPGLGVVKPSDGGCIAATALTTTPAMSTHLQSSTGHAQVQASGGGGMGDAAELGAAGTATADAPASLAGVGAGQGAALLPSIKFQVASQVLRLNSELQYPGLCPCHGLPLLPHLPSLQLGRHAACGPLLCTVTGTNVQDPVQDPDVVGVGAYQTLRLPGRYPATAKRMQQGQEQVAAGAAASSAAGLGGAGGGAGRAAGKAEAAAGARQGHWPAELGPSVAEVASELSAPMLSMERLVQVSSVSESLIYGWPQLLVPTNYDYELEQDAAANSRAAGALAKALGHLQAGLLASGYIDLDTGAPTLFKQWYYIVPPPCVDDDASAGHRVPPGEEHAGSQAGSGPGNEGASTLTPGDAAHGGKEATGLAAGKSQAAGTSAAHGGLPGCSSLDDDDAIHGAAAAAVGTDAVPCFLIRRLACREMVLPLRPGLGTSGLRAEAQATAEDVGRAKSALSCLPGMAGLGMVSRGMGADGALFLDGLGGGIGVRCSKAAVVDAGQGGMCESECVVGEDQVHKSEDASKQGKREWRESQGQLEGRTAQDQEQQQQQQQMLKVDADTRETAQRSDGTQAAAGYRDSPLRPQHAAQGAPPAPQAAPVLPEGRADVGVGGFGRGDLQQTALQRSALEPLAFSPLDITSDAVERLQAIVKASVKVSAAPWASGAQPPGLGQQPPGLPQQPSVAGQQGPDSGQRPPGLGQQPLHGGQQRPGSGQQAPVAGQPQALVPSHISGSTSRPPPSPGYQLASGQAAPVPHLRSEQAGAPGQALGEAQPRDPPPAAPYNMGNHAGPTPAAYASRPPSSGPGHASGQAPRSFGAQHLMDFGQAMSSVPQAPPFPACGFPPQTTGLVSPYGTSLPRPGSGSAAPSTANAVGMVGRAPSPARLWPQQYPHGTGGSTASASAYPSSVADAAAAAAPAGGVAGPVQLTVGTGVRVGVAAPYSAVDGGMQHGHVATSAGVMPLGSATGDGQGFSYRHQQQYQQQYQQQQQQTGQQHGHEQQQQQQQRAGGVQGLQQAQLPFPPMPGQAPRAPPYRPAGASRGKRSSGGSSRKPALNLARHGNE